MSNELHVTSLVLQVQPEQMALVRSRIIEMDNADASVNNEIKLVVVLEGDSQKSLMTDIETINAMPGVLSTSMVYHQSEVLEEGEK